MKNLLMTVMILMTTVVCFAQTTVNVWDCDPNDGRVEAYFSNSNVDVVRYHLTWYKDNNPASFGTAFSDTTFMFIGGLADGNYVLNVQALDANNQQIDGTASESFSIVNPAIPYAPYPVLTVNEDYSVHVQWSQSVNADHYKIEWSNDQYFFFGDVYSKVVAGAQTSQDIIVDNGQWYFKMYAYSASQDEGTPSYAAPFVIVDKPLSSHLIIPWFTSTDTWQTTIFIKLPDDKFTADLTFIVTTPDEDPITISKTVHVNGVYNHKGYVVKFDPSNIFSNTEGISMIKNGSIEIISNTVGIHATVEIKARHGEMSDTFNAIDIRDVKTEYEFPAVIVTKENETGSTQILAFALHNISEFNNNISMTVKYSDGNNVTISEQGGLQIFKPYGTYAWILTPPATVVGYSSSDTIFCTVKIKSINELPFYIVASSQTKNPTMGRFASWIEPLK